MAGDLESAYSSNRSEQAILGTIIFLAWNQLYDWQTHGVLTLMMMMRSKNNHCIFTYKLRISSIDMKTKVVWHVPKIIFKVFQSFQVFDNIQTLGFLVPSFCLTFRHFFIIVLQKARIPQNVALLRHVNVSNGYLLPFIKLKIDSVLWM